MDHYTTLFKVSLTDYRNGVQERSTKISDTIEDGTTWNDLIIRFGELLRGHGYIINPAKFHETFESHEQETFNVESNNKEDSYEQ